MKNEVPLKPAALERLRQIHPPLVAAEDTVREAEQRLEAAREDLRQRETEVERLPAEVASARSPASVLEKAVRARDTAKLVVPAAEQAGAAAQVAVEGVIEDAIGVLARSIRDRREKLRRELAGAKVRDLQRFVDADCALCGEAGGIVDVYGRDRLRQHDLGEPLRWPACWVDQMASIGVRQHGVTASKAS